MKTRMVLFISILAVLGFLMLWSCDLFVAYWNPLAKSSYFLFATYYAGNTIWSFQIDAGNGALSKVGEYSTGDGPRSVAAHPEGRRLAISTEARRTQFFRGLGR